jgi:hypothetical protein
MPNEKTVIKEDHTLQGSCIKNIILEEGDRRYIQKHILFETDFDSSGDELEESDCTEISDDGHDKSSLSNSDVKRVTCGRCWRYYHAEYMRARIRKAHITIDKTIGQYMDCEDSTLPLLNDCCIRYYEKWL